jgi:RNA polymerase sigma factor (sigma-70 family)
MEGSVMPRLELGRAGIPLSKRLLRLTSDERLVEHVRAGSQPAFEVIFDRHHRGVLAFCRHMLGSVEEAEDAVQHTFMAAYGELVRSGKEIALRPWLYAIARNRCVSCLRARRESPVAEIVEPSTENLSAAVQRRIDLRDLLRDLVALPDDQRAALVLAEVGAVSYTEIAEVLGCPREKVKALVFQARSSLIASRTARETSCGEIRLQLATLRGGSLRRTTLRRHLKECPGCREFRAQLVAQRRALALALPVVPTVGLKAGVLGGMGAAGSSAGAGALAVKALAVVAVAGGGAAAGIPALDGDRPSTRQRMAARPEAPAPRAGVAPARTGAARSGRPELERLPRQAAAPAQEPVARRRSDAHTVRETASSERAGSSRPARRPADAAPQRQALGAEDGDQPPGQRPAETSKPPASNRPNHPPAGQPPASKRPTTTPRGRKPERPSRPSHGREPPQRARTREALAGRHERRPAIRAGRPTGGRRGSSGRPRRRRSST